MIASLRFIMKCKMTLFSLKLLLTCITVLLVSIGLVTIAIDINNNKLVDLEQPQFNITYVNSEF